MNYILRIFFVVFLLIASTSQTKAAPRPIVEMETSMGTIVIELNHRRAPGTVNNFLHYVKKGFYSGTIFHRVISDFMIQGGGYDTNSVKKTTRGPIRNESTNGLNNTVGTIAMARTEDIDSATSQFYINVSDNRDLDATYGKPGYTVFGVVIEGMDVVMKIAATPVQPSMILGANAPVEPVIIKSVTLLQPEKKQTTKATEQKTKPIIKEEK